MSVISGIASMQQFLQGFAGIGIASRLLQLANEKAFSPTWFCGCERVGWMLLTKRRCSRS
jgi:hypothetical protein